MVLRLTEAFNSQQAQHHQLSFYLRAKTWSCCRSSSTGDWDAIMSTVMSWWWCIKLLASQSLSLQQSLLRP